MFLLTVICVALLPIFGKCADGDKPKNVADYLKDYKDIASLDHCPIKLEPLGCYKDKEDDRALPTEILNGRDTSRENIYNGPSVDWQNFDSWLSNFLCKCAIIALQKGERVIGGQYFGECWSGGVEYNKHSESEDCIDTKYQKFAEKNFTTCAIAVGKQLTNFAYRIAPPTCRIDYQPMGCFQDSQRLPRPLRNYISNERDSSHVNWNKIMIDWKNWKTYSPEMICRCAETALKGGYDYFGIQYYGECWAGTKAENDVVPYTRDGPSTQCKDENFNPCPCNSYTCVGIEERNYVYKLVKDKSAMSQGCSS